MRIAIVGGGISGLVSAHLLSSGHEVTLFEAGASVGGHTHTIQATAGGREYQIDTGFIVFNEPNYPAFNRLLQELGVKWQTTSMSFGVRCDRTGIEWCGTSLSTLFAQRRNLLRPRFLRFAREILRFNSEARAILEQGGGGMTVEGFARERGYSEDFRELYLVPLGGALWSSPPKIFRGFPIELVVEFLHNHAMLQVQGAPVWRVVEGGSSSYLEPLTRSFRDRLRLSSPVHRVTRHADRVDIHVGNATPESFDEVIFACHSDQALAMLADPTDVEGDVLGAFPYQRNEITVHTDTSVLPHSRRAWASWNYHVPAEDSDAVSVTYDMNRLQGLDAPETFCVTLNGAHRIDPSRVLRRLVYHHPQFTPRRAEMQARHRELIRARRSSFCGAYWGYGFHEDGVQSALRVCAAYGVTP